MLARVTASARDRIRGAFLGTALGDAFGRPFEGASRHDPRHASAVAARASSDAKWDWSDDTEMLIGVAESILAVGGVEPEHLIRTLARNYDPARGYGHGAARAFDVVRNGGAWRRAAFPTWKEGSRGSGAAVRVAPIACFYHRVPDRLDYAAQASAAVTHAHRIARVGCMLHARAIASLLGQDAESFRAPAWIGTLATRLGDEPVFREKLGVVRALLDADAPLDAAVDRVGNGVTADDAVPLALFAFARSPVSFEGAVTNAVRCGGDTDTVAAMTGALAGALVGESRIPGAWLARLERGDRGREYLATLADRVCDGAMADA